MHEEDSTIEEWRPVPGWEGFYSVSNHGRVRSEERVVPHRHTGTTTVRERILRPSRLKSGHLSVGLWAGRARRHSRQLVHRLVMSVFDSPCPDGLECCHDDGDPTNNRLSNLRWDTRRNNCQDTIRHDRTTRGERASNAKLCAADVLKIRHHCDGGDLTHAALASRFGVSRRHVTRISQRKRWASNR